MVGKRSSRPALPASAVTKELFYCCGACGKLWQLDLLLSQQEFGIRNLFSRGARAVSEPLRLAPASG